MDFDIIRKWMGLLSVSCGILLYSLTPAFAQQGTAMSGKLGTLGLGLEAVQSLREHVNGKIGFNMYSGSYDGTSDDDVEYDIDVSLRSVSFLVDWHPYEGEFRVCGGFLYNGNNVDVRARPTHSIEIGDTRYSPAEIGTLKYDFDFRNIAPYLGIGVGNALRQGRTVGFVFDAGLLFQGSPRGELTTENSLLPYELIRDDVQQEEAELEDDLSPIRVYPVVSFGFTYRFK